MEDDPEIAKLYAVLERYRRLLHLNTDPQLRAALHVEIRETEEKLAALRRHAARNGPDTKP